MFDPAPAARLRPVRKLNGVLRLDHGQQQRRHLTHHVTMVQETTMPCVFRGIQRTLTTWKQAERFSE